MTRDEYMNYLVAQRFAPTGEDAAFASQQQATKSYTPEQAVALYNNLDPALANDPAMLQQILRGSNYWKSEGNFLPGEKITTADNLRAGIKQWAHDDEGGGLGGLLGDIWSAVRDPLEEAAVLVGNYFVPGSSILTSKLASKDAQEDLSSPLGRIAQVGSSVYGGLNPSSLASEATSGIQTALSEAGVPAQLLTKPVLMQAANLVANGGDIGSVAKGIAMGQITGEATGMASSGLQAAGINPILAKQLAQTGVNAVKTGNLDVENLAANAGLSALNKEFGSPTLNQYVAPVSRAITTGNIPKGTLENYVGREVASRIPKTQSPLSWFGNKSDSGS